MNHPVKKCLGGLALACFAVSAAALELAVPPAGQAASPAAAPSLVLDLASVLEPADAADAFRFTLAPRPQPTGWALLLGGLLTGGFIARRRLSPDFHGHRPDH